MTKAYSAFGQGCFRPFPRLNLRGGNVLKSGVFCLVLASLALGARPEPRILYQFRFESGKEGWRAGANSTLSPGEGYRGSKASLRLRWNATSQNYAFLECELKLTLTPDTWLTFVYRRGKVACKSLRISLITDDGEKFVCRGFSAPSMSWRRLLIRISFDWWAKQFCLLNRKGRVPSPGTKVTKLIIGATTSVAEGSAELSIDDLFIFEAFGDREIRKLFNPRGVIRPPRPCPIEFKFPANQKHPYLITTPEAIQKTVKAYRKSKAVRKRWEQQYARPVKIWVAQFIGKLKAPGPVKPPEDAGRAEELLVAESRYDEILNPEPPPPEELTEEDWQKCFELEFKPHANDPRYLEERAAVCPRCARGLSFDPLRPKWHQCPRCKRLYKGPAYDNVWNCQMQRRDIAVAVKSAWMYRISGEERWGRLARKIALAYCEALEEDRRFQYSTRGATAFIVRPSALIPIIDLLADTPVLSNEEEFRLRDNFITRSIRASSLFDPTPPGGVKEPEGGWFHYKRSLVDNQIGHALKQMMWTGLASQNEDYIKLIFDMYDRALYNGLNEEGVWWEKSIDYQIFFRTGMIMLASLARKIGVDLIHHKAVNGNSLQKIYDAELKIVMPNNELPSLNDGGRVGFRWGEAYRFFGDKKYHRTGKDLLPLPCYNLPITGWCVLRSSAKDARDQTYLLLDYGTGSGAHAHPDTMQIILYARRKYVSPDLGVASYYAKGYWSWYKNPKSHNTMTPLPSRGKTIYFEDSPRIKIIDVETARRSRIYYRRTDALVRNYIIDLFLARSEEEQNYTWRYHNIGTLTTRTLHHPGGRARWEEAYWDIAEKQLLRLSTLCHRGTAFKRLVGFGFTPTQKLYYIAIRRRSKNLLVPAIIEPFIDLVKDTRSPDAKKQAREILSQPPSEEDEELEEFFEPGEQKRIENLPFDIAGQKRIRLLQIEMRPEQTAFCVEDDSGRMDYFLASYNADESWSVEGILFRGELAFILIEKNQPTDLLLIRGLELSVADHSVELSKPASVHLYSTADGLRIHAGEGEPAELTLRLKSSRPGAVFQMTPDGTRQKVRAEIHPDSIAFELSPSSDYLIELEMKP